MACAITSGYTLDCRDSMGGVKEVYLIALADVSSFATASGVVTGLTKATGKQFYKFEQLPQTCDWTEAITGSDENGSIFYAPTLNIQLNKSQAAIRNQIKLIAANRCIAIVKDRNGVAVMLGATIGLSTNAGQSGSGKAFGDLNGSTLTLSGGEPEPYFEVNSTVYAALTTPG
jgi:hypothetical protein